ncbi:MAG: hypothetical protein SFX73_32110 [Kofleriaceae bacterium]|nr:hypothetical protein [Kofleriaceae bacterium]
MEGPVSKLRFGYEMHGERVQSETEDEFRGVFGYDATLRLGIVSAVLEKRCGEECPPKPWFDIGPGAGLGFAVNSDFDFMGHAWAGAWADVRLSSNDSYWVLRVELQQDAYSGDLRGDTQVVVGMGWLDWDCCFRGR